MLNVGSSSSLGESLSDCPDCVRPGKRRGLGGEPFSGSGDTLVFDVANRLASYTTDGNTTTFTYDADGARVVRDGGATESVYIGGIYEETGTYNKSYYSFNGAVVAYREESGK